jgi:hypothetical protein
LQAPSTTTKESIAHFADRSAGARSLLDRWIARSRPLKVDWLMSTSTRVAYRQTPDDVERIAKLTIHPLGDIEKSIAELVWVIRDWRPTSPCSTAFITRPKRASTAQPLQEFQTFRRNDKWARRCLPGSPMTHFSPRGELSPRA